MTNNNNNHENEYPVESVKPEVIQAPVYRQTGEFTAVAAFTNSLFSPANKLAKTITNTILETKKINSKERIETLRMEIEEEWQKRMMRLDEKRLNMIERILSDTSYNFDERIALIDRIAPTTTYTCGGH